MGGGGGAGGGHARAVCGAAAGGDVSVPAGSAGVAAAGEAAWLHAVSGEGMKVGIVVPGFGADERDWCIPVLVDVLRALAERAEVHVFALRYPGRKDRYRVHGIQVQSLGGGEARRAGRLRLLRVARRAVIDEHRRGAFSVLHGLWLDEPAWVASSAGCALGVPSVASVMGGEL